MPHLLQVHSALQELFSVRCPSDISGDHADFDYLVKFLIDFEDEAWTEDADWGSHTFEDVPFCGRGALRKPRNLFDENDDEMTTISIVIYTQVTFEIYGQRYALSVCSQMRDP